MSVPLGVQAGRILLNQSHPYLAPALWRLGMVVTDDVPTMGVDKYWRLYINPTWVDGLTPKAISTVLYHEVLHLLRVHGKRAELMSAHQSIWSIAADCEINDDLQEEHLEFPSGPCCLPKNYGFANGKLTEEYYNELMKNATFVEVTLSGGSGDSPDGSPTKGNSGRGPGDSATVMNGDCGSGADGRDRPWEKGDKGDDGVSGVEATIIAQSVAEAIRSGKDRGSIPGHWERWADKLLSPAKVPWQRTLSTHLKRAFSTSAGRVDYSYVRPSRRQSAYGKVVMPSLRKPNPEVVVIVDTSGSMGEQDIQDALSEIKGILESVGQRNGITVMSVDAAVHTTQRVFDARKITVLGGGGTDMGMGLNAARELKPTPSVVVVLTDGYTPWPKEQPPFEVVIALIGGMVETPPWARTVVVE